MSNRKILATRQTMYMSTEQQRPDSKIQKRFYVMKMNIHIYIHNSQASRLPPPPSPPSLVVPMIILHVKATLPFQFIVSNELASCDYWSKRFHLIEAYFAERELNNQAFWTKINLFTV